MDDTLKNKQNHETDVCRGIWEDPELIELSVDRTEAGGWWPNPSDGPSTYS
jgi:hypothetical protein